MAWRKEIVEERLKVFGQPTYERLDGKTLIFSIVGNGHITRIGVNRETGVISLR